MLRRVAITGAGVVSAIGCSLPAFFKNLSLGNSGIKKISRFDCSTFQVQLAAEVNEHFSMPPSLEFLYKEDVKVVFAFKAFRDALEQAGFESIPSNAILHVGTSLEAFDLKKAVNNGKVDFKAVVENSLHAPGTPLQIPLDTASKIIAKQWGEPRQSLVNCSACSASLQAMGHAFWKIRRGETDAAFCGGYDSMINPLGVGGFMLLGALSAANEQNESACRPFDSSRSGTVLGEGAAIFALEPYEKAKAEGKRMLAEVCGYGSSLDSFNLSAPDPQGDGAERAMRAALSDASIDVHQIDHINAHGTATRLNDEIEAMAIRRLFSSNWEKIPVSATKSLTGHLIGAAGAIESAACLLPLLEGLLPPNPFLSRVAKGCELNHVTSPGAKFNGETVLNNSFGFGGQNACLILRRIYG